MAQVDLREVRKQQLNDTFLGFWVRCVRDKKRPAKYKCHTRQDSIMLKTFRNLKVIRGVLYREIESENEKKNSVSSSPLLCQNSFIWYHNNLGHPSKDRTLSLLRDRFFWPGMFSDTESWISNCSRCIRRKSRTVRAPLINITTSYPLELVCIDNLTLEPSKGNISNRLVITDLFTWFAMAIHTKIKLRKQLQIFYTMTLLSDMEYLHVCMLIKVPTLKVVS